MPRRAYVGPRRIRRDVRRRRAARVIRGERGCGDHHMYNIRVFRTREYPVCRYMYVCVVCMRLRAYILRANYKGILDKTRCTYDETVFYAVEPRRT